MVFSSEKLLLLLFPDIFSTVNAVLHLLFSAFFQLYYAGHFRFPAGAGYLPDVQRVRWPEKRPGGQVAPTFPVQRLSPDASARAIWPAQRGC